MIDPDKLRALDEAATPDNIEVRQHTKANADAKNKALDRVKLSNQIGPLGGFERADGELLAYLWNSRAAILVMAEREKRMREALEDARLSILCAAGVDDDASADEADSHIMSWGGSTMSVAFGKIASAIGEEKA